MTPAGGVVLHAFPEGKRAVPLPCGVSITASHLLQPVYSCLPLPRIAAAGFRVSRMPEHGARFGGDLTGNLNTPYSGRFCTKHAGIYDVTCAIQRKLATLTGGWRAAHPLAAWAGRR